MPRAEQRDALARSPLSPAALARELDYLEPRAKNADATVTFCHNDLLPGNILFDESAQRVTFLDVEYGSYNYRCFDIGNHWNEFTWDGTSLRDELFPTEQQQREWCQCYLTRLATTTRNVDVSAEAIERLRVSSLVYSLASELFWVAWALLQASTTSRRCWVLYDANDACAHRHIID